MVGGSSFVLVMGLLAVACGTSAEPQASVESSASASTTSTTTTSTTTTSTSTTEYQLPDDFEVSAIAVATGGETPVVVAGRSSGQGEVLGRVDQADAFQSLASLFPDQQFPPVVTSILSFDGSFFAFVMGHDSAVGSAPTILTSPDGRSWSVEAMSVVLSSSLRFTPDSPPYPGPSGIVGASIVTNDEDHIGMIATGWAELDGVPTAMAWETADGRTWRGRALPNQGFDGEYGAKVAGSEAGTIVGLGGPIHTGVGTIYRHPNSDWLDVPLLEDEFVASLGASRDGLYALVLSNLDGVPRLTRVGSDNGWSDVGLPEDTSVEGWSLKLEISARNQPVVYRVDNGEGLLVWTLDRGSWEEMMLEGDRIVWIDANHIITASGQTLFISQR